MTTATMTRPTTSAQAAVRPGTLDEDMCYAAILQRRQTSDGLFFTAVTSTKIYCRPSCPSRTPLRKNVRFFRTADEAEAAGFRACKRCKPRDPLRSDAALAKAICRTLDALDKSPTLAELSREFNVSPFHLQRTFTKVTGLSPRKYAEARRTERLKTTLRNGNGVTPAVYAAGYSSSSRVYETASAQFGMTPGSYGRGGAGMRIRYTITTCTYGRLLVAATERGVSAVKFGQNDVVVEEALREEYPSAEIARDDGSMHRWVKTVLQAVEGRGEATQLPLDILATVFRRRVWDALRAIPRGETRTYSQIAAAVGSPKAARAVGNACHVNPVAVVIPCHRVVAEGGGLGGYAYGIETKKKLLASEGAR